MKTTNAVTNATKYTTGASFSDGNIVVGTSARQLAIAWNNTAHNANNLTVMELKDAIAVYSLLGSALKEMGVI